MIAKRKADLLILGMGAAAQMCALYAHDANPGLDILIASKTVKGKGGSSRMVQQGLNAVLSAEDSHDLYLMDTLKGGHYINDQELVKTLVEQSTPTAKELETRFGCFFDRNPDGTIHQPGFANATTFNRKVRKGEFTGIEILSRLTEQVLKRGIPVWDECRALDLLLDRGGQSVTGALLLDVRRGSFFVVEAAATVVATGGGPSQYRFSAPGADKCGDGLAMLYRAGALLRDMEMVHFHPSGLVVPGSVAAGTVFERGLRGAGAYLYNGRGERYMLAASPDGESAGREQVCRRTYLEMQAGRACAEGGVHLDASHLGGEYLRRSFPATYERCLQFGYDLGRQPVPVAPTAQFFIGGAAIDSGCRTNLERLFVAGEDAGGVHGANLQGGNGITESCVFGRQAGMAAARSLADGNRTVPEARPGQVEETIGGYLASGQRAAGACPYGLLQELRRINWDKAGIARTGSGLAEAAGEIAALGQAAEKLHVPGNTPYNPELSLALDLRSLLEVSRLVVLSSALREESRGAYFRLDAPQASDDGGLFNTFVRRGPAGSPLVYSEPVRFKYKSLEECQQHKKKQKKRGGQGPGRGEGKGGPGQSRETA